MTFVPVAVGETIAGKYLVERIIGEGGMGVVIAARHTELDQTVAIKFLLPEIAKLDMAAERFRREAWAVARIRGEHVCRVLDVGTLPNGVPFMVMEYLEGCDLATELHERKALPAEEAVDYVLQSCEALAEAHAAGIVHRDLKPANLFLAQRADGTRGVKVLDFGVSKVMTETGRAAGLSLTSTKTLVGSPLYMSPEQLDSAKGVDARTDIWALGVVLYELITGRTPFNGDSIAQLVSGVLHADPPPFTESGIVLEGELESVVKRAVSKRREDRHANIAELAADLVPYGPATAALSATRTARMLAREGSTSLPVGPGGERPITPRGSLQPNRTPNRTPSDREPLQQQERTPGQRGSGARESTPVSWEKERSASRRKRAGLVALALLGAGLAAMIAWPRGERAQVPPGASDRDLLPPSAQAPAATAPSQPTTIGSTAPALRGGASLPAAADPALPASAPAIAAQLAAQVDAGLPPQPPTEPPQPEPVRPRENSATREPALRRSTHHASERPLDSPQPASNSGGISDFGGRR